jgi:polysaccharide deacetylase family protein (PEP-CTERM system associated)
VPPEESVKPIRNGLSIDVEDWRQLVWRKVTGDRGPDPDPRVLDETYIVLELLAQADVRATFFVLAEVARVFPSLVVEIDRRGHEVASHGWDHSLVFSQSETTFRRDTAKAKHLLEDIIGKPIYGYRAAEFSITRETWWAFDVLAEVGFEYDSSIYPIPGRRYGIPDAPLGLHAVVTPGNRRVVEVPPSAVRWWNRNWPVGGGGSFRLLPYTVTRAALNDMNAGGRPGVLYLHPYDVAREALRIDLPALRDRASPAYLRCVCLHNFRRAGFRRRLGHVMTEFDFVPLKELIDDVK